MKRVIVGLSLLAASMTGCTSLPTSLSEPVFHTKQDIFQNHPVWESQLFSDDSLKSVQPAAIMPALTTGNADAVAIAAKDAVDATAISPQQSPGLYYLLNQVDHTNLMLSQRAIPADAPAPLDSKPLPEELAAQPIIKTYVVSLAAANYNSTIRVYRAAVLRANPSIDKKTVDKIVPAEYPLNNDDTFKMKDFLDLGNAFINSNLSQVQDGFSLSSVKPASVTNSPPAPTSITYRALALKYYVAYYQGKFVDRDGGTLAKPSLGLTITDDTLCNAATIGLESLFDYTVVSCAGLSDDKAIHAPIVYDMKAKKWLTAKSDTAPTLAVVLGIDTGNFKAIPNVIEDVPVDTNHRGLNDGKLALIRLLDGAAGDGASGLNGVIVRTFGGVHLGFTFGLGALGKVSVGDNSALAKLIEASTGTIATRTTELFASNILYDVTYDANSPASDMISLIQFLSENKK